MFFILGCIPGAIVATIVDLTPVAESWLTWTIAVVPMVIGALLTVVSE